MTRKLRETILWIGATLGVLCLGWTLAMFTFGLTPLVFTSGSMSPTIEAGDLAFATTVDADEVAEGDVVSVINDRGTRITHRVTQVDLQDDDSAILQLQGDANQSPDQEAYLVSEVERVNFSVPKAGYVVDAAGSPLGMFVGGLLVAAVLFLAFRRPGDGDADEAAPAEEVVDQPEKSAGDRGLVRRAGGVITLAGGMAALVAAGTLSVVQPTTASWTDTPVMTTGGLSAMTLASAPAASCSGSGGTSVTLSWGDLGPLYEYVVVARDSDGGEYSRQTVRGNGTTVSAVIARRTLITYTAYEHSVTVTPRLRSNTAWVAPPTVRSIWERYPTLIGVGNRVFCEKP